MKNRPDRTALLCLGIATVLYIGMIISLILDNFMFLFAVFALWPTLALLIATIFFGVRALRTSKGVWNWSIVIVSSLMLVPYLCAFTAGIIKFLQQS